MKYQFQTKEFYFFALIGFVILSFISAGQANAGSEDYFANSYVDSAQKLEWGRELILNSENDIAYFTNGYGKKLSMHPGCWVKSETDYDAQGLLQVEPSRSEAESACAKIGGRLPRYGEVYNLMAQFGLESHKEGKRVPPTMTKDALKAFYLELLPGHKKSFANTDKKFSMWTSSTRPDFWCSGYSMNSRGELIEVSRSDKQAVRCVRDLSNR